MQAIKLFRGKKVRVVWDQTHRKHWVSVVDICSVLCGSDYDTARNYWKQLKHRLISNDCPLLRTVHQIRLLAKDGKLRYTDVMDYKKIMQLIQLLPYNAARAFKAWLGGLAAKHFNLVSQLDVAKNCAVAGITELRCFRARLIFNDDR